jgi:hypothetical protein
MQPATSAVEVAQEALIEQLVPWRMIASPYGMLSPEYSDRLDKLESVMPNTCCVAMKDGKPDLSTWSACKSREEIFYWLDRCYRQQHIGVDECVRTIHALRNLIY